MREMQQLVGLSISRHRWEEMPGPFFNNYNPKQNT
jgi:hypothetical protein